MSMKIIKPGMLSQFQDGGRWGYQSLGVSVCGAMDLLSHQLANLIVGNTEDLATLEITLIGPTLTFSDSCCVCLAGADMQAKLNGKPVTRYRPLIISPGDTMTLPQAKEGTRAYLAAYGGFAITPLLGSQSTYLRSGFGGWHGRGLKAGDEIALNISLPTTSSARQALSETLWNKRIYLPSVLGIWASRKSIVRWIRSEDWSDLTTESQAAMHKTAWRVANDADRMGFRLDGPKLTLRTQKERLSEPTTLGTMQLPVSGQPIVLMADRQTTGGYPQLGCITSVDLPILAQKKPGDRVHFMAIDLDQASALDAARQEALKELSVQLTSMRHCIADAAIPTPLQED